MDADNNSIDPQTSAGSLHLDPHNANRGTERGRALVGTSLEECGAGRSILIDQEGTVIAGNKTLEEARRLGLPVRVVETAGEELVAVKRTDLLLREGGTARRLAFLDNRSAELGLNWDPKVIFAEFEAGLDFASCGFNERELSAFLAMMEIPGGLTDPDEVPEVPEVPVTRPGDLWLLGRHRLKCGDATSPADVADVLEGTTPFLMVTDPPYGVEYDPAWRNEAGLAKTKRTGRVTNDERLDWTEAHRLFPGDVAYVWHAGRFAREVAQSLEAAGFEIRVQIIWRKAQFAISRGHYHWQHEPCWYAVREGRSAQWRGDHSQSTVWDIGREDAAQRTFHGTQKPVECMLRAIRNHGRPGERVYDPFAGSGTTLIAAEMLGRHCLALEIEPAYVDVAVMRWQNFTGLEAQRREG